MVVRVSRTSNATPVLGSICSSPFSPLRVGDFFVSGNLVSEALPLSRWGMRVPLRQFIAGDQVTLLRVTNVFDKDRYTSRIAILIKCGSLGRCFLLWLQ